MALLENPEQISAEQRAAQNEADKRAMIIAAVGWVLTLGALVGLPGPDFLFMGLAPAIAIVSVFPALMGLFFQRYRGGFARVFLFVGAAALLATGVFYFGRAGTGRVIIAYFLPALFLAGAAFTLAAPRIRAKAT